LLKQNHFSEAYIKKHRDEKLIILSEHLKQKFHNLVDVLKRHYEQAYSAKLNYAKFKFIQDVFGQIYFIGIDDYILYTAKDDRLLKVNQIIRLKAKKVFYFYLKIIEKAI
jgi:hypothetical protein